MWLLKKVTTFFIFPKVTLVLFDVLVVRYKEFQIATY